MEIRDNVSLTVRGALGDKVASVEQTDADQWSWWVHVDKEGGAELASGTADSADAAKAAAIKAAGAL